MSEREIREAIREVSEKLDRKNRAEARKRGRKLVYPMILGAGLMVANCDDESTTEEPMLVYGVPATGTQTGSGGATGGGTSAGTTSGGGGAGGQAGQPLGGFDSGTGGAGGAGG